MYNSQLLCSFGCLSEENLHHIFEAYQQLREDILLKEGRKLRWPKSLKKVHFLLLKKVFFLSAQKSYALISNLHHGHHPAWLGICFGRSLGGALDEALISASVSAQRKRSQPCLARYITCPRGACARGQIIDIYGDMNQQKSAIKLFIEK